MHMKKALIIFTAINVMLLFWSIPMTVSFYEEISINANCERALQTLASITASEKDKQQMKNAVETLALGAKSAIHHEESNKDHLRLIIVGYVFLVSGMSFYLRKKMPDKSA